MITKAFVIRAFGSFATSTHLLDFLSFSFRLSSIGSRDESSSGPGRNAEPPDPSGGGLVQRCVIIQRDEKGYGFTVSGDNPVFVASVKAGEYRPSPRRGGASLNTALTATRHCTHYNPH